MKPLGGPHHFTGVTRDVKTNVDFWCRVMGLRFVKNTLNYETTFRYHTYFGDEEGNPGSVVTFLEFKEAPPGVPGRGDIHRLVLRVASYDSRLRHIPSIQEDYARAAAGFGVEVTREAVSRGVRISAGSDHVAYGPVGDRASLFGELKLLVASIALTPTAALLAATRDAARAIGGDEGARIGTIATGHYADLVLLTRNPLESVDNLDSVEWVMVGGKVWRPGQLRSGIAMR